MADEQMDYKYDTSKRNVLTFIFDRKPIDYTYSLDRYFYIWILTNIINFAIPMIYCYVTQPSLVDRTDSLQMPFLLDIAMYPIQLILVPLLIVHIIHERRTINSTLSDFFKGPALAENKDTIIKLIDKHYRTWNPIAAIFATLYAAGDMYLWWREFLFDGIITWHTYGSPASHEVLNFGGYYCAFVMIGLCNFLVAFVFFRGVIHYFFFKKMARMSKKVNVFPLHPDGCGGLAMITNIVKLYQLIAFSIGIVIATYIANDYLVMGTPFLSAINIRLIAVFIVFAIASFVCPLLPFHSLMRNAKENTIERISFKYKDKWESELNKIESENDLRIDSQAIENMRTFNTIVKEMPVWPFDFKTIRSFFSVVFVPIVTVILGAVIQKLVGK